MKSWWAWRIQCFREEGPCPSLLSTCLPQPEACDGWQGRVQLMAERTAVLARSYQPPFTDTGPNPLWGDQLGLGVLVPVTKHMGG